MEGVEAGGEGGVVGRVGDNEGEEGESESEIMEERRDEVPVLGRIQRWQPHSCKGLCILQEK